MKLFLFIAALFLLSALPTFVRSDDAADVVSNLKEGHVGSTTDVDAAVHAAQTSRTGFSAEEQKIIEARKESHHFEAEVGRLMGIIINSLYVDNDVYMRELISNASDALDKIRFLALTDKAQLESAPDLNIRIKADPESGTLSITDTGIGMTKEELIKNLGRIAQSGTREFLEKVKSSGDSSALIGQFGVGFYSAFLVADRVTVTSKSNESPEEYIWTSTADNNFEVFPNPKGVTLGRGTTVTLHLKEDAKHFMEADAIRSVIAKYSSFINFPIHLWTSHEESHEVPLEPEEIEKQTADVAEGETEEELPQTKTVKETVWDWELLNDVKPLWIRSKDDITAEEYNDFYKALSKDYKDPLGYMHFSAEGEVDFSGLLYIPSVAPSGMFEGKSANLKLYVRRVFITDEFDDILPKYLAFLRGIVDSDDLPLNVSRESLQHHKTLKIIKKKLVRKALQLIQDLYDNEDKSKYADFWEQYAVNIKLGLIEDQSNRSRLSKLLMFHSSKTGELTRMEDYVKRMKEGQEQIYYLTGTSVEECKKSPLVEKLLKKDYEVLFMTDPIDEYMMQNLPKFDGEHRMTNIARENLKLDGESTDEDLQKQMEEDFKVVTDFIKAELKGKLEKVVLSNRLTDSPAVISASAFGYTAQMERVMRAQALADPSAKSQISMPKKVMEINPRHPILKELRSRLAASTEDPSAKVTVRVLYETGMLSSGFAVDDLSDYAGWVYRMMQLNLNLSPDAKADPEPEYIPPPATEKSETKEVKEDDFHEEL